MVLGVEIVMDSTLKIDRLLWYIRWLESVLKEKWEVLSLKRSYKGFAWVELWCFDGGP